MNTSEISYAELASNCAKPGQAILDEMTATDAHNMHMSMGLSGEVGELAAEIENHLLDKGWHRENTVKEFGDLEFYLEGLRQGLGINRSETLGLLDNLKPSTKLYIDQAGAGSWFFATTVMGLCIKSGAFVDEVKKSIIYSKPLAREKTIDALAGLEADLECLRIGLGITRAETLTNNMTKLKKRYNSGAFSTAQAVARVDLIA